VLIALTSIGLPSLAIIGAAGSDLPLMTALKTAHDRPGLVTSPAQAIEKRGALIEYIFGSGLPDRLPDLIDPMIYDAEFSGMQDVARIDRLTVKMEYGINSIAYRFVPTKPAGSAVIYHQGHLGHFAHGKHTIKSLIGDGHEVVAMSMPLLGPNSKPTIESGCR
jgi:hypothetical protein